MEIIFFTHQITNILDHLDIPYYVWNTILNPDPDNYEHLHEIIVSYDITDLNIDAELLLIDKLAKAYEGETFENLMQMLSDEDTWQVNPKVKDTYLSLMYDDTFVLENMSVFSLHQLKVILKNNNIHTLPIKSIGNPGFFILESLKNNNNE